MWGTPASTEVLPDAPSKTQPDAQAGPSPSGCARAGPREESREQFTCKERAESESMQPAPQQNQEASESRRAPASRVDAAGGLVALTPALTAADQGGSRSTGLRGWGAEWPDAVFSQVQDHSLEGGGGQHLPQHPRYKGALAAVPAWHLGDRAACQAVQASVGTSREPTRMPPPSLATPGPSGRVMVTRRGRVRWAPQALHYPFMAPPGDRQRGETEAPSG